MGECPWLNRPLHPSYDSRKALRVQSWTYNVERSDSPPESVLSLPQASLVSDASFTTFAVGEKRPMPGRCWPEWCRDPELGSWDEVRDSLRARPGGDGDGEGDGERRRSEGNAVRAVSKDGQRKVEQDLRSDKTLPPLPPPTPLPASTRSSGRTALAPTPELTLATTQTQTTSRPSFSRTQSHLQSQPHPQSLPPAMRDRMGPPELGPRRHLDMQVAYLKPTRNSLALRPASLVMKPESTSVPRPKSLQPSSLQPSSLPLSDQAKHVKTRQDKQKSLRPSTGQHKRELKPSSIKTLPVMQKRKPISLRSEDLEAIPGVKSRPPKVFVPRTSDLDPTTFVPRASKKDRYRSRDPAPHSSVLSDPVLSVPPVHAPTPQSTQPIPPTQPTRSQRPKRPQTPEAVVDEEEAKLEHISRLMAELEVESSSDDDEVRRLFAEFRRVRRERRAAAG